MSLPASILSLPTLLMLSAAPATGAPGSLVDPTDTAEGALPMQPKGDMAPTTTPEATGDLDGPNHPMALGDKVLFVNFDGADMNACNSGPQNNCSNLFFGTVLPYSGDAAKRASVIQIVRTRVNDFGISVTDTRPASGDYDMEMVGDWAGVGDQGFAGVAPSIDCFDNRGGEVSFTLDAAATSDGIAEIILQEVSHTWGLEHVDDQGDLLYPTTQGQNKIFKDECLQIVVLNDNGSTSPTNANCNQMHTNFCSSNVQNSYQEMLALFGPGIPDTTAPTVQIISPADGDVIEGDVNMVVSFDDNQSPMIINTTITIDSPSLTDGPAESDGAFASPAELEFPIQGLPSGEYTVTIDATDEEDNPTSDSVTFTVVGDPPAGSGGDASGGGGSGGEETSGGTGDGSDGDGSGGADGGGGSDGGSGAVSGGDTDGGTAGASGDNGGCAVEEPGSRTGWAVLGLLGLVMFRRRRG